MLKLTKEQDDLIWNARDAFNARSEIMAANHAGAILEGNSLAIPLDAWRRIDTRAQQLARSRLVVFNRLAQASTIPVSMADLVNYYPQVSDSGDVLVSMDGRNTSKADSALTKYDGTPVPIFTSNTRFGWRQMEVMRKGGGGLDTVSIANNQRRIAEKMEDMVLNGLSSIVVNGLTIYGLRNHPGRNTFVHGFTLATATGAQWLAAIQQLMAQAQGDNQYGQISVFANLGDYTKANTTDYAANYSGSILQRLLTIGVIKEIIPSVSVPANELIGVVDLDGGEWGGILNGMPMTTRPKFRAEPEDDYVFGVIAAAAPQFRVDYAGQSPFIHGTQS